MTSLKDLLLHRTSAKARMSSQKCAAGKHISFLLMPIKYLNKLINNECAGGDII